MRIRGFKNIRKDRKKGFFDAPRYSILEFGDTLLISTELLAGINGKVGMPSFVSKSFEKDLNQDIESTLSKVKGTIEKKYKEEKQKSRKESSNRRKNHTKKK